MFVQIVLEVFGGDLYVVVVFEGVFDGVVLQQQCVVCCVLVYFDYCLIVVVGMYFCVFLVVFGEYYLVVWIQGLWYDVQFSLRGQFYEFLVQFGFL